MFKWLVIILTVLCACVTGQKKGESEAPRILKPEAIENTLMKKNEVSDSNLIAYNKARGGLNMRSLPGKSAAIIAIIPFKAELLIIQSGGKAEQMNGQIGNWVKVKYGQKSGWVFDAFLTKNKPAIKPGIDSETQTRRFAQKNKIELFTEIKIQLDLITGESGKEQLIGRLEKRSGYHIVKIKTLQRICGQGEGETGVTIDDESFSFHLLYRWCKIDPGDQINFRCINCNIVRYTCSIKDEEIRERLDDKGLLSGSIRCNAISREFCEADCFS